MPKVEKIGQVFECKICGNVVEIKAVGGGELICCGQPMVLINQEVK
ncbi:MAG: desulfoferrodoxin FeS4 iron-binding domain-containing protein [Atribacterota bacterium]|jgi:desulfoferrodoxin-like iron-binding protein|nr:desulfoferrodoxin FeS4 iron-binding domain-containing protein [Atribacterota bacterium]HHT09169.1 desulfoferrodoxin FeS4 iron-binding domain-containing protein [Candidatus Atribacteria bacterium]